MVLLKWLCGFISERNWFIDAAVAAAAIDAGGVNVCVRAHAPIIYDPHMSIWLIYINCIMMYGGRYIIAVKMWRNITWIQWIFDYFFFQFKKHIVSIFFTFLHQLMPILFTHLLTHMCNIMYASGQLHTIWYKKWIQRMLKHFQK